MKKFVLFLLGLSLFLGACGNAMEERVVYLEFIISDNPELVKLEESSVVNLRLEPDYAKRTFKITYFRNFVSKQEDVVAEGTLGGENFEKLEKVVRLIDKYDPAKVEQVAGVPNFKVQMAKIDGTIKSVEAVDNDLIVDETVEELRTYYLDWVTLLTEEEQI